MLAAGHLLEDRVGAAVGRQLHSQHPDLGRALRAARPAQRVGQQLVAQAHTQERALQLSHPAADGPLLGHEPGVLVGVPHVHRAAHDPHGVVVLQRRDGLALVELHRGPFDAVGPQEVAQTAGMLAVDVLQDEQAHATTLPRPRPHSLVGQ